VFDDGKERNFTNDMTGAIFTNRYKRSDKQPDYTGKVTINGEEYRIAGWKRTDRNGNAFMSIALTDPESLELMKQKREQDVADYKRTRDSTDSFTGPDDGNDDIPF